MPFRERIAPTAVNVGTGTSKTAIVSDNDETVDRHRMMHKNMIDMDDAQARDHIQMMRRARSHASKEEPN